MSGTSRSRKRFYAEVLGLTIREDHSDFVLFDDHFAISQARELVATIWGGERNVSDEPLGRENLLLYFETPDLDETYSRIAGQVVLIHPVVEQHWGQRVFRFYDPDGHVIEVGEPDGSDPVASGAHRQVHG